MLNLNFCFCFSCSRESNLIQFNKYLNPKILFFTHFLNPGLKLYINLKYSSSFFIEFYFKKMYKIIETVFIATISYSYIYRFNKSIALICDRFVNAGEPAAVSWISIHEKVVDDHKTLASAAGSLFGWSLGRGFEAIILNGCVIAWLLGIFLIVNCQLECLEVRSLVIGEILEERSLVIGEKLEERSLVIGHWSLVGGFEAIILNGCVVKWLLGIFLIVNCQLLIVNC